MDRLSELLEAGNIALDLDVSDFDACLAALAGHLRSHRLLDREQSRALAEELRRREELAATCIGRGVVIPHAYLDAMPRVMLLFARLRRAVEHGAPDGQAVDLVFLLAGPTAAQPGHLPLLARLVRLLHDQRLLDELRAASAPEEVLRAVRAVERRHA